MPALLGHGPYAFQKPPPGSQVDWGHQLSVGLKSVIPLNEGGGKSFSDLVTRSQASFNIATIRWTPTTQSTSGLLFPGGAGCWTTMPMAAHKTPYTIAVTFTLVNAAASVKQVLCSHDAGNNGGYGIETIENTGVMAVVTWGVADSQFSGLVFQSGVPQFAAVTVDKDAGTATGYLGTLGKGSLARQTITAATINNTTPSNKTTFSDSTGNNRFLQSGDTVSAFWHYKRVLMASEIDWLFHENFAMLRGPDVYRRTFAMAGKP